jgi:hypothetical protein
LIQRRKRINAVDSSGEKKIRVQALINCVGGKQARRNKKYQQKYLKTYQFKL